MKKLFKYVLCLVIVMVVGSLGSTYYVSQQVEKRIRALAGAVVTNSYGFMDVTVDSYRTGLFKSEAILLLSCKICKDVQPIKTHYTIWNGPVIYTGESHKPIAFELAIINPKVENLPKNYQMNAVTKMTVHYNTEIDSETRIESLRILHDGIEISSPLWKEKSHINQLNVVDYAEFEGPSVLCESKNALLSIDNFKMSFKREENAQEELKTWNIAFEKIAEKIKNVTFHDLNIDWKLKLLIAENNFNNQLDIKFKQLEVQDKHYENSQLTVEINNIDKTVIEDLVSTGMKMAGLSKDVVASDPMILLQKFLLKKPELVVKDTSVSIPEGKIEPELFLSVGGDSLKMPIHKENLDETFTGRLKVNLPKDVFVNFLRDHVAKNMARDEGYQKLDDAHKKEALDKQMDIKIKKLMLDGVISENNGIDTVQISIEKGKWVLNGKEVSSPIN